MTDCSHAKRRPVMVERGSVLEAMEQCTQCRRVVAHAPRLRPDPPPPPRKAIMLAVTHVGAAAVVQIGLVPAAAVGRFRVQTWSPDVLNGALRRVLAEAWDGRAGGLFVVERDEGWRVSRLDRAAVREAMPRPKVPTDVGTIPDAAEHFDGAEWIVYGNDARELMRDRVRLELAQRMRSLS